MPRGGCSAAVALRLWEPQWSALQLRTHAAARATLEDTVAGELRKYRRR